MFLEPEITLSPQFGYEEVHHPEWFEAHAGLDESGKGDLFGPVVCATVIADGDMVRDWMDKGIKDSKRLGDSQIFKMEKVILKTKGAVVEKAWCGMRRYNELMARPRANLNTLIAWLHSKALEAALEKRSVAWGMLDQFSRQPLVQETGETKRLQVEDGDQSGVRPGSGGGLGDGPGRILEAIEKGLQGIRRGFAEGRRSRDQGTGATVGATTGPRPPGTLCQAPLSHQLRDTGIARSSKDRLGEKVNEGGREEGQDRRKTKGRASGALTELAQFDWQFLATAPAVIGLDEAGRGPLAGPVCAAAVYLDERFYRSDWYARHGPEIDDSKRLSEARRERIFQAVETTGPDFLHYAYRIVSVEEIESLNILGATRKAMELCLKDLQSSSNCPFRSATDAPMSDEVKRGRWQSHFSFGGAAHVLVDGRPLKPFAYPHTAIVKGDGKSLAIALASIVAKVTRDRHMRKRAKRFPGYGFSTNKGYGTALHIAKLKELGPCRLHRKSFIRKIV